jgi:hypothetical protein
VTVLAEQYQGFSRTKAAGLQDQGSLLPFLRPLGMKIRQQADAVLQKSLNVMI